MKGQGLAVWARHVGDPRLAGNLTRRTDLALFIVAALEDDRPRGVGHRRP